MPLSSSFDRVSLDIITSFMNFQDDSIGDGSLPSSPLRRANFDLLYRLCTQASAHRLLWELERSASMSPSSNIDDIDDNPDGQRDRKEPGAADDVDLVEDDWLFEATVATGSVTGVTVRREQNVAY